MQQQSALYHVDKVLSKCCGNTLPYKSSSYKWP